MSLLIRAGGLLQAALLALAMLVATPASAVGDTTLVYRGGSAGKVVFDGRLHASKGFDCKSCHTALPGDTKAGALFETRKVGLITEADHGNGVKCFACHNGTKASIDCQSCHRNVPNN